MVSSFGVKDIITGQPELSLKHMRQKLCFEKKKSAQALFFGLTAHQLSCALKSNTSVKDLDNVSGGGDSVSTVCEMCGNTRSLAEIVLIIGFKNRTSDRCFSYLGHVDFDIINLCRLGILIRI